MSLTKTGPKGVLARVSNQHHALKASRTSEDPSAMGLLGSNTALKV